MELKIGQTVVLLSDRFGCDETNPVFESKYSTKGEVIEIYGVDSKYENLPIVASDELPITVKWNNGCMNTYKENDLSVVSTNKPYKSIW